jgi:hypothetical protein
MLEECCLVNTHTVRHGTIPATHKQGSQHIDFMFISRYQEHFFWGCGIPPFESIFASEHRPLYGDFDVISLFGNLTIGTEKTG